MVRTGTQSRVLVSFMYQMLTVVSYKGDYENNDDDGSRVCV